MKAPGPKSRQINPKAARYRLRVAHSTLHRYGVFALEDIPRHRRVIEYTGKRLTYGDAARIRPPERYLHRRDEFHLVRGRQIGRKRRSVHQPFMPAQFDVAMRPQPALLM